MVYVEYQLALSFGMHRDRSLWDRRHTEVEDGDLLTACTYLLLRFLRHINTVCYHEFRRSTRNIRRDQSSVHR